jgi:DNA-binding NarL/FixJ family response regulator
MSNMTVLVADDHALVRGMISAYLRSRHDVALVLEAVDGVDLVEQAQQRRPDVVVVDVRMPRKNGLDAAREIKTAYPDARVIVMSNEESFRSMALANLADAFVPKASLKQALNALLNEEALVAAA